MKIYQVTYRDSFSEHKGYEYFSNRKTAEKIQTKNNKERDETDEIHGGGGSSQTKDEVREIEFNLTKHSIIELLNSVASHPDNG